MFSSKFNFVAVILPKFNLYLYSLYQLTALFLDKVRLYSGVHIFLRLTAILLCVFAQSLITPFVCNTGV